jgi:hypothetical protein
MVSHHCQSASRLLRESLQILINGLIAEIGPGTKVTGLRGQTMLKWIEEDRVNSTTMRRTETLVISVAIAVALIIIARLLSAAWDHSRDATIQRTF